MLHKCAVSLTDVLLKNNAISADDHDVYVYGWEMILSTGSSALVMLLLAIIFKQLPGSLLFMFCFLSLRGYAGGYHANSYLGCFCTMMVLYGVTLNLSLHTPEAYLPLLIGCLIALSILLVFIKAPQEHPNRPLTDDERITFTFRSRLIIIVQSVVVVALFFLMPSLVPYLWWAVLGMTAASVFLLISNGMGHDADTDIDSNAL